LKKIFFAGLFLVCAAAAFAQQAVVIVPQFDLTDGATNQDRDNITRWFMGDLANKKIFRVAERGQVEKRQKEEDWQLGDYSNEEKTTKFNKGINANYLIIGTISKISNNITIDAKLEDLSSFEIIGTAKIKINDIAEAFDLMEGFVNTLVRNVGNTKGPSGNSTPSAAIPANFVFVEGGTFTMGSPDTEDGRYDEEDPQHQVTVSSFYMGRHEVTQLEYETVMGSNPSYWKGGNLPVEQVSWHDAIEYCNKRSVQEGLTPAYSGSGNNISCDFKANGYRLPTEAEWEFTSRGGIKNYSTGIYSGSNNADSVAWYDANSGGKTHPVGTKAANSLGLYDMSGNVWEWCWDWFGAYGVSNQTDPAGDASGVASGSNRVYRGGGWSSSARYLRSAYRSYGTPSGRSSNLGFRLVRS